jgi:hypothetical protein
MTVVGGHGGGGSGKEQLQEQKQILRFAQG